MYQRLLTCLFTLKHPASYFRFEGYEVLAEDPRLVVLNNSVYVVFITYGGINLTPFDRFQPVPLRRHRPRGREKNWAPFVYQDKIHFVYSYDPLMVLAYDLNPHGDLTTVYHDPSVGPNGLPDVTESTKLRGKTMSLFVFSALCDVFALECDCHEQRPSWDVL